jgi:hypothetical protein
MINSEECQIDGNCNGVKEQIGLCIKRHHKIAVAGGSLANHTPVGTNKYNDVINFTPYFE